MGDRHIDKVLPFKLRELKTSPLTPEQEEVINLQAYLAEQSAIRFQDIIKAVVSQVTKREFQPSDAERIRLVDVEDITGKRVLEYYWDKVLLGTVQSDFENTTDRITGRIIFVPLSNLNSGEEIVL